MAITTMSSKGQIVIPAKIRSRYNLKEGTRIHIEEKEQELILRAVTGEYFRKIAGTLKTKGRLSKQLISERKRDRDRGK